MSKLLRGDFPPCFRTDSSINPEFNFNQAGGRRIVLCFFGSARQAEAWRAFEGLVRLRDRLQRSNGILFGVSADPGDRGNPDVLAVTPRVTVFWDTEKAISRAYGAARPIEGHASAHIYRPMSVVLDENMRLVAVVPVAGVEDHAARVLRVVEGMAPPHDHAPVLILPDVFEPAFCAALVALHDRENSFSGQMTERNGQTYGKLDRSRKSRTDHAVTDPQALDLIRDRFNGRVRHEIAKVFAHTFTRMERYLIGCYDAADGGCFEAHRDNNTKGTAHRAFAVSVSLNDDYEGGGVRFAEYGPRVYRAPVGGAVVFSCSLMHEVLPVVRGRRCVFLTFVYDEAGQAVRNANARYLVEAPEVMAGA